MERSFEERCLERGLDSWIDGRKDSGARLGKRCVYLSTVVAGWEVPIADQSVSSEIKSLTLLFHEES